VETSPVIRRCAPARAAAFALLAVLAPALSPSLAAEPAGDASALDPHAIAPDPLATAPDPLAASADADDFLVEYEGIERDPLEPSNRVMFGANEQIYYFLFDPLADVYGFVVPQPVRRSVRRFFDNLGEPANCLNELLQLNPARAGRTGARFAINSTVGVAGLFDLAGRIGLAPNETDFGETLGVYGIGHGWYLVVPVLGPSSVRDLFGDLVNGFMHPQNYLLAYTPGFILATGSGFSRYEAARDDLDALRDSSIDFYAAMRSAYMMQREADVRDARADSPVLGRVTDDVAAAPD
jgi:phospholipid-binding lipoprotein MlaA